jgi:hypothetical protein
LTDYIDLISDSIKSSLENALGGIIRAEAHSNEDARGVGDSANTAERLAGRKIWIPINWMWGSSSIFSLRRVEFFAVARVSS